MENNDLVRRRFKRAIFLVSIAALFGCSYILFDPVVWRMLKDPLGSAMIFPYMVSLPVGVFGAYLLVFITRFVFKSFLKEKITYIIFLIILMILGYGVGFLSSLFTWRLLAGTL